MRHFKNLLFFANPGVGQDTAIQRASIFAKQNDAGVTIMSVIKAQPNTQRLPAIETDLKELQMSIIQEHRDQLEGLAKGLRGEGISVQVKVVIGIAFIEVIREVLRARHDLVIMAADRRHGILNRLFGSTSMHLMRKCPCPVWVVKPGGKSYKRVLAAVDVTLDPGDRANQSINPVILQLASSMARMNSSELHVVQVWSVFEEGYLQVRGNMDDQAIRRLRKDTKQDYARKLDYLMGNIDLEGIASVRIHLKRGDEPAPIITKLAQKEKIDLLVMGTVCRTGLAGFFIGNTAEEVLNAADCSVLTVKPEGFVSPVTLDSP